MTIFTSRQRSCGKVMSSIVSVSLFGGVPNTGIPPPQKTTARTCSNLFSLDLTTEGPPPTCSQCSLYVCRQAGAWHSTEILSCFLLLFCSCSTTPCSIKISVCRLSLPAPIVPVGSRKRKPSAPSCSPQKDPKTIKLVPDSDATEETEVKIVRRDKPKPSGESINTNL